MTPTLATRADQVRHYAEVRARLRPPARRAVPKAKPEPTPAPPSYATTEEYIAAILAKLDGVTPLRAQTVILVASEVYGLPPAALLSRGRKPKFAVPRQVAMAICVVKMRDQSCGSLSSIGKVFKRDHTTLHWAYQKFGAAVERCGGTK